MNRYRREGATVACALEDMALLYHRPSGQTHMVISPVPELLDQMQDGAVLSAQELHDRMAQIYDLGPREEALAQVEAHLSELVALGLVRRI